MAIQMRRGLKKDFDPSKMLPGEWAVSIDSDTQNQIIWMCFGPGIVKRMGTYEDFRQQIQEASADIWEPYEETINEILATMRELENSAKSNAATAASEAKQARASEINANNYAGISNRSAAESEKSAESSAESASDSQNYSKESKSYAVGTGGEFRPGDDADCAKAYYEQSKQIRDSFSDIGAVAGVKGNAESTYRSGLVNITPENIGSYNKQYIDDNFVPGYVSSARVAIYEAGWHRIAKCKDYYDVSCVLTFKRRYSNNAPEYQMVQFMGLNGKQKFVCLAAFSQLHMFTKIRETWDEATHTAYIEIYQDRDGANSWRISVEDALEVDGVQSWKAIQTVKTEETVSGVTVKASLDLPANFDIGDLLLKTGTAKYANVAYTLNAADVRDSLKPSKFSATAVRSVLAYFTSFKALDGSGSDTDYVDVVALNTYMDASAGNVNALVAVKHGDQGLYHYTGPFNSNSWAAKKKIAYTDSDITGNAATATKAVQDGNGNVITDTYAKKDQVLPAVESYFTNFNDLSEPGFYRTDGAYNAPEGKTSSYFSVMVLECYSGSGGKYMHQIAFEYTYSLSGFNVYVRLVNKYTQSKYGAWKKISLADV